MTIVSNWSDVSSIEACFDDEFNYLGTEAITRVIADGVAGDSEGTLPWVTVPTVEVEGPEVDFQTVNLSRDNCRDEHFHGHVTRSRERGLRDEDESENWVEYLCNLRNYHDGSPQEQTLQLGEYIKREKARDTIEHRKAQAVHEGTGKVESLIDTLRTRYYHAHLLNIFRDKNNDLAVGGIRIRWAADGTPVALCVKCHKRLSGPSTPAVLNQEAVLTEFDVPNVEDLSLSVAKNKLRAWTRWVNKKHSDEIRAHELKQAEAHESYREAMESFVYGLIVHGYNHGSWRNKVYAAKQSWTVNGPALRWNAEYDCYDEVFTAKSAVLTAGPDIKV